MVVVVIGWLGSVVNVVKFLVSIGAKLVVNVDIWVSFLVVVEVAVLVGSVVYVIKFWVSIGAKFVVIVWFCCVVICCKFEVLIGVSWVTALFGSVKRFK